MNGSPIPPPAAARCLRVASYNVHECGGAGGGPCAPERIAQVLEEIDAPVVGLQEVASLPRLGVAGRQLQFLAEATGMTAVAGPTLWRRGGDYGNALLTRHPVREVRHHDLSVSGREPRGVLEVHLEVAGEELRVVVTHLGLRRPERQRQAARLGELVAAGNGVPTLVLADANEWLPFSRSLAALEQVLGPTPAPKTFPAALPVLALDRIWVHPASALVHLAAHRSLRARRASDHLPLVAEVCLEAARAAPRTRTSTTPRAGRTMRPASAASTSAGGQHTGTPAPQGADR